MKMVITLSDYLVNKNHSISLMNSVIYFVAFCLVSMYDTWKQSGRPWTGFALHSQVNLIHLTFGVAFQHCQKSSILFCVVFLFANRKKRHARRQTSLCILLLSRSASSNSHHLSAVPKAFGLQGSHLFGGRIRYLGGSRRNFHSLLSRARLDHE